MKIRCFSHVMKLTKRRKYDWFLYFFVSVLLFLRGWSTEANRIPNWKQMRRKQRIYQSCGGIHHIKKPKLSSFNNQRHLSSRKDHSQLKFWQKKLQHSIKPCFFQKLSSCEGHGSNQETKIITKIRDTKILKKDRNIQDISILLEGITKPKTNTIDNTYVTLLQRLRLKIRP